MLTARREINLNLNGPRKERTCGNNEHIAWGANPEAGTRKTLEIEGVEFAFRFCPSGTFPRRSPESEEERKTTRRRVM